jgi:hypothetical protein
MVLRSACASGEQLSLYYGEQLTVLLTAQCCNLHLWDKDCGSRHDTRPVDYAAPATGRVPWSGGL